MAVIHEIRVESRGKTLCSQGQSSAGSQAVKILEEGAQPGNPPVLCQPAPTVLVNTGNARSLGIELPPALLKIARRCEQGAT